MRKLVPRFLRTPLRGLIQRTNAERFGIDRFLQSLSSSVKPSDRVLDAGAGGRDYRNHFSHARYESTDITTVFTRAGERHTFISELHHIPVADNSYDLIVNTQVLEHVEFPQVVINEFHRILKPNGRLLLTTPQSWGVHMAPYHFFNFTRYGLESLFRNARFTIEVIKPNGGIFWNLAKIISKLPSYLYRDFQDRHPKTSLLLHPAYLLARPFCEFALPLLLFYLDSLDKNQGWTIGYLCCCRKATEPSGPSRAEKAP